MSANVDQKRVLKFGSLQEFNAVSSTLEYPGLFMIGDKSKNDEDGTPINRSASRAAYYALGDAEFGDILMAQISTNKMFTITSASYNLEDYPFADYKPIAVCIFDKASNANNQSVFMSVQWLGGSSLGNGFSNKQGVYWGYDSLADIETYVPGIGDTGTNHVSSISINNSIKTLVKKDYSGSSITNSRNQGDYDAFGICWRFSTPLTNEGDWLLPSYYDVSKMKDNMSTIQNVLTVIKTVAGSSYLSDIFADYGAQWIAHKNPNSSGLYGGAISNDGSIIYKRADWGYGLRAVLILNVD